jgi:RHS repeat-associated protein
MFGLSSGDAGQNYTDIDFAVYLSGGGAGTITIFEAGTNKGTPGTFTTGDVIRVAVDSGVVKYKKNGTTFYTSSVSPTYPLNADTSLYSNGSTLNNAKISGNLSSGGAGTVHWLVPDQLGTPRMILDQTGTLANVKRHDYLPFGEEIVGTLSGRGSSTGYGGGDGVRQQFTLKERDNETGLDYFSARYFSSVQGRFLSPDEFSGGPDELYRFADDISENPTFYADLQTPQSLNKYHYSYNNPLRFVDADGHEPQDPKPVIPIPVPGPGGLPLPLPIGGTGLTPAQAEQMGRDIDKAIDSYAESVRHETMKQVAPLVVTGTAVIVGLNPKVDPNAIPAVKTGPIAQPVPITQPQLMPRPIDKPRDKGHKKGKDHNKHTRRIPGTRQPPNFKPRVPKRPQDKPDPDPKGNIGRL